jgi:hypothetical protein
VVEEKGGEWRIVISEKIFAQVMFSKASFVPKKGSFPVLLSSFQIPAFTHLVLMVRLL